MPWEMWASWLITGYFYAMPSVSRKSMWRENTSSAIELRAALINQHLETMSQILTGTALLEYIHAVCALNAQFDRLRSLCVYIDCLNKRLSVRGMKTRVRARERTGMKCEDEMGFNFPSWYAEWSLILFSAVIR